MLKTFRYVAFAILLSAVGAEAQAGDTGSGNKASAVKYPDVTFTFSAADHDAAPKNKRSQAAPPSQVKKKRPPMVLMQWGDRFPN